MLKILLTSLISQFFLKEKKWKGKERKPLLCNILKLTEIVLLQEPSVTMLPSSAKDVVQQVMEKTSALKSNKTKLFMFSIMDLYWIVSIV